MLACHRTRSLTVGPLLLAACIGCAGGESATRSVTWPLGVGGRATERVAACRTVLAPERMSTPAAAPQHLPMPLPPLPERLDGDVQAEGEQNLQLDEAFGRLDQATRSMPVGWSATDGQRAMGPARLPKPTADAPAQCREAPPTRSANQPPATSPWVR